MTDRSPRSRTLLLFGLGFLLACLHNIGWAATEWSVDTHVLASGDFDGDGKDDVLAIGRDSDTLSGIALSDSGGQPSIFHQTWSSNYLGITWHSETYLPHIGDFDGDGQSDVFLQKSSGGNHYLLLTNGDGKLVSIDQTISNSYLSISWSQAERRIDVGDFSGDSVDDLLLQSNSVGTSNALVFGSLAGSFSSVNHTWANEYLGFEWSVPKALDYAGDFNNDGYSDALIQAKPDWLLIPYEGLSIPIPQYRDLSYGIVTTDGTGKPATSHQSWDRDHMGLEWSPLHYRIFVGDYNGDGYDDIFLQAKRSGDPSYIVLTDSAGKFTSSGSTVYTFSDGTLGLNWNDSNYELTVGDFDGNGRADIYMQALTPSGTNRVAYTASNGNITSTPSTHSTSAWPQIVSGAAMEGSFSVSQTGEVLYSIPIFTPTATGGMKPNLSLSYGHRSGMQIAGQGWGIGGLSAITRCAQTIAQDGLVGEMKFDSNDRFCLDGQRLEVISGSYGGTNSEYRTEIESFKKIVASGTSQGGGPRDFTVTHTDGTIYRYGHVNNSSLKKDSGGSSPYRFWALYEIEDLFDNKMSFSYTKNDTTGEFKIDQIEYTIHTGITTQYDVQFNYEARPSSDQRTGYEGGASWTQDDRLESIEVSNTTNEIYTYSLSYITGTTGRSQLSSVQQCRGTLCLPATTFEWQDGQVSWGSNSSTGAAETGYQYARRGDFNGDGLMDIFLPYSNDLRILKSTGTSFTLINTNNSYTSGEVIEFNGDGLSDIIFEGADGDFHIYESTGNDTGTIVYDRDTNIDVPPLAPSGSRYFSTDHDGDGIDDLLLKDGTNDWDIRYGTGSGYGALSSSHVLTTCGSHESHGLIRSTKIDFNNDGRDDILVLCKYDDPDGAQFDEWYARTYVATATGYSTYGTCREGEDLSRAYPLDINGDGMTDLACYDSNSSIGWYTRLSTGTGFATATVLGALTGSTVSMVVADYDGDGRQDLLGPTGTSGWYVNKSTGTTLSTTAISIGGSTNATDDYLIAMDMTGDGYEDLVYRESSLWRVREHNSAYADVVTKITDGLGNYHEPTYEPITTSAAYTESAPADNPPTSNHFQQALYVAEQHVANDGIGGSYTIDYTYQNALVNLEGRGFLGFDEMTISDPRGGTKITRNSFEQDFPYTGRIDVSNLEDGTGKVLRSTTTTWDSTTLGSGAAAREFVFADVTTTTENDLDGTTLLRTIENDPIYDTTYGYVESTEETITEPGSPARVWTTDIDFNPTQYTTPWCIGLPGLVQTTKTLPDLTSSVRKVRYTFNSSNCSLTEIQDESETSTAKQLETTFTYDAYGNVNVVSYDSVDNSAQNRALDFDYDNNGQFPTSVTQGTVNLTTEFTWNALVGERESVKTPDGLTTDWDYDAFGRVTKETRPGNVTTDFTYLNDGACPWLGLGTWCQRVLGSDGSDNYQYWDTFNRPVGNTWQLVGAEQGMREIVYSSDGEVEKVSQPYKVGETPEWVEYTYDILGRVLIEVADIDDGSTATATTTYTYTGRDVDVEDELSNETQYEINALGQIETVINVITGATDYSTAYTYRPFGELHQVTDADGNLTTIAYDARGNKTTLTDPNMNGNWVYDTNVYGELVSQTNPASQVTTMTYDAGGRISTRYDTVESATTTYTYYGTGTGRIGKPDLISGPGHSEKYDYSSTYGTPTLIRRTLDSTQYDFDLSYDSEGRLDVLTYPDISGYRFKADYDYDSLGNMTAVKDGNTSSYFYVLSETDARGQEAFVTLGNGLDEEYTYDRATGYLEGIKTGPLNTATIQDLTFTYDDVGNLYTRANNNITKTETFLYDEVNRLESTQVSGGSLITMSYSPAGRLDGKSDVDSTYTYTGGSCPGGFVGGPFAPRDVAGVAYCYDNAGRMTSRGSDTYTWYSYGLPKVLSNGSQTAEFSYGVDRQRYKQVKKTGTTTDATIYYIGQLFEKEIAGSTTTYRHHVYARENVVATVERVGTTNTVQYMHRDHQGSVVEVTGSTGSLVQSLAYDAWGLRRNPSTWASLISPFGGSEPTERGYTGHEHLDSVELIHMNGRVQNPVLGIFVSPDPIVQAPFDSQNYNRYAYVRNNPGTLIDPSGFCWDDTSPNGCYEVGGLDPDWVDRSPTRPIVIRIGVGVVSSRPLPRADTMGVNDQNSDGLPDGLIVGAGTAGAIPYPGNIPSEGIPRSGSAGSRTGAGVLAICAANPWACAAVIIGGLYPSSVAPGTCDEAPGGCIGMLNESSPDLPTDIVGEQDDKAGPSTSGTRHNSGPLAPEHGGTGDAETDFDVLGGGSSLPTADDLEYPPGTRVAPNGVVIRPGRDGQGPRIDIPRNGSKPAETLHY